MEDVDNLSPSKKRDAGRELTRDTPLDNKEEDAPEVEGGTFKRASDEVLATRRIVKVHRQQTNSAPSSNPFAGIRLITPTEATAEKQSADEYTTTDDSKDPEEEKDEGKNQSKGVTCEAEDKSSAGESNADKEQVVEEKNNDGKQDAKNETKNDNRSESEDKKNAADKDSVNKADKDKDDNDVKQEAKNETKNDNIRESEDKKNAADKESFNKDDHDAKNTDKKENSDDGDKQAEKVEIEEPSSEGGTFKSFQQLSSNQNAFTGLAGTGSNTSLSSFGSMSKEGPALSSGTSSNNANSGFGVSGASATISSSEGSGLALQEVATETGEENENVIFHANSVLFEFANESWKERGKGELKVNVHRGTENSRLLMRARGNYRVILNARLYPDMKLQNMDKKGVSFACINSASEGKDGLSTFALKFKDDTILKEFKCAVMAHKGDTSLGSNHTENSTKVHV